MARVPMVTRTIKSTEVSVLAVDTELGETFTETYMLARTYKDNSAIMKKVQKLYDTETLKNVSVVDVKEHEALYGMTEEDFIKYSKELPEKEVETEE